MCLDRRQSGDVEKSYIKKYVEYLLPKKRETDNTSYDSSIHASKGKQTGLYHAI